MLLITIDVPHEKNYMFPQGIKQSGAHLEDC